MTLKTQKYCQASEYARETADWNFIEIELRLAALESGSACNEQKLFANVSGRVRDLAVSIRDFGAVPDGTTDCTDAIEAALEFANGVAAGTWESGSDTYGSTPSRARRPVYFPPGTYLTTRVIPIRYFGVSIFGARASQPSLAVQHSPTKIVCDFTGDMNSHTADCFFLDATYNVFGFDLRYVSIEKPYPTEHDGTGCAVGMKGPNYQWGPTLEEVFVTNFGYGLYVKCEDKEDYSGSIAYVKLNRCAFNGNGSAGVWIKGHAILSQFRDSSFCQNSTGIKCGGKGLIIDGCDLEDQYDPLHIDNGSNSANVTVRGCYFESNDGGENKACIVANTVNGLTVDRNYFAASITIPKLWAEACTNVVTDVPAVCRKVRVLTMPGQAIAEETVTPSMACSITQDAATLPVRHSVIPSVYLVGAESVDGTIVVGSREHKTMAIDALYRYLPSGFVPSWGAGELLCMAFAIQYTDDVPHGNIKVLGLRVDPELDYFDQELQQPDAKIGDTITYLLVVKNTTANPITDCRLYISPYGADTTPGDGAKLTQIATWIQAAGTTIPQVNALDVLCNAYNNLVTYPEALGSWTLDNCTVGSNAATAPNGTVTADSIIENDQLSLHEVYCSAQVSSGKLYLASAFVKAADRGFAFLGLDAPSPGGTGHRVWLDLATGLTGMTEGSPVIVGSKPAPNGFWRVWLGAIAASTGTGYVYLASSTADGVDDYQGVTSKVAIYGWGAVLEVGATEPGKYPDVVF
jgi:hypothetical protein